MLTEFEEKIQLGIAFFSFNTFYFGFPLFSYSKFFILLLSFLLKNNQYTF